MSLCVQVFTFTWREDIRPGDPQHTKKFCFDAVSHTSPVTLYDCHSMKGNQLWKYRQVRPDVGRDRATCSVSEKERKKAKQCLLPPPAEPTDCTGVPQAHRARLCRQGREARNAKFCVKFLES